MRVVGWEQLMGGRGQQAPVALTVGVFDSLHLGHRRLIRAVVDNPFGALGAVCTFRQNPAQVLGSRALPGSILSLRQKLQRLEGLGVAVVVLIDFSTEISTLTGKRFLDLLTGRLTIRRMVVGYNFHMGQGRDTGVEGLKALLDGSGTELQVVPAAYHGGEIVSSSRIRSCIREGRFDEAAAMMGQDYCLDLREAAVRRGPAGWSVARQGLSQVLPRCGPYEALRVGPRGAEAVLVSVEDDAVLGEGPGQGMRELCFKRRLEGHERGASTGPAG